MRRRSDQLNPSRARDGRSGGLGHVEGYHAPTAGADIVLIAD
jgi:hypothetical protein